MFRSLKHALVGRSAWICRPLPCHLVAGPVRCGAEAWDEGCQEERLHVSFAMRFFNCEVGFTQQQKKWNKKDTAKEQQRTMTLARSFFF